MDLDKQSTNWLDIARPSLLASVVLIGILAFIAYELVTALPPRRIVLSTGNVGGAYHTFGLQYQARLADYGIEVELLPGAGSIETLERLGNGMADVGFVQTGTADLAKTENLNTIASLFYEPIWVFHRAELAEEIATLGDLRGLRIGVGQVGSGTRPVALQLLSLNNVTAENSEFVELTITEAAERLIVDELDAAFMVISPRSELVLQLLDLPSVALLNVARAEAYSRAFAYITQVSLPEGIVDFAQNVPPEPIQLLAVTGTMNVPADAHPNLVRLLAQTAEEIHREGALLENLGEFPSDIYAELPIHPDARNYFDNGATWFEANFPFNIAIMLDRLVIVGLPLLTLFTLYRTFQPIYLLHVQYQTARWYRVLGDIDLNVGRLSLAQVEGHRQQLRQMLYDLTHRVSIPFFYWNRVYVLKAHIIQVLGRLDERRATLLEQEESHA